MTLPAWTDRLRSRIQRRVSGVDRTLDLVYQRIAAGGDGAELPRSAEWLLDNFALIGRAIRQLREGMQRPFERRLPLAETGPSAMPRVYRLAERLMADCAARLDPERLAASVREDELAQPLTIAEAWALPEMVRLVLLETTARLAVDDRTAREGAPSVGDCVRSLLILERTDWRAFFEQVNVVEAILQHDPAGVYATCDFATRDSYRKQVEEIALRTARPEADVAEAVVRIAAGGQDRDGYIGTYLLGEGRPTLERHFGYRPAPKAWLSRLLLRNPTRGYLGSIAVLTVLQIMLLARGLVAVGTPVGLVVAVSLLALLAAVSVAVAIVNAVVTRVLPPVRLPKLDLRAGIPDRYRTLVVVPAMLGDPDEIDDLLRLLEIRFLGNRDRNLHFALLTDLHDAAQADVPADALLLERASQGIHALNARYQPGGEQPFHLLHRRRQWNPRQHCWMGWERKRGKLEELNALLLGAQDTSYATHVGVPIVPGEFVFVITLDADTELPRGTARRMVETLAHPLNRARFAADGRVTAGYTVLQPRVEIHPADSARTPFSRVRSGDSGLDPYSHAVSDVYQDLFGEGTFVGKGIYDVAAFHRSTAERVPENALLSHDLFEGIHGRAGLISDVVLLEDYPERYLAYAHRMQRWARGDWQLLPWLGRRVPVRQREPDGPQPTAANRLSLISRWKIVDNLRRALLPPVLVALLAVGWFAFGVDGWLWSMGVMAVLLAPAIADLAGGLSAGVHGRDPLAPIRGFRVALQSWLFQVVTLAYEAAGLVGACFTTLYRVHVSRSNMLQWTAAAHSARLLARGHVAARYWLEMAASPLIAVILLVALAAVRPAALPGAAPLLIAWLLAPQIALRMSRRTRVARPHLSVAERHHLRGVACRTWAFFESFVGPDDQWLPPDHFQEDPLGRVAHRTSPTNIGLMAVATVAAYDFGYGGPQWVRLRLAGSFRTLDRLARHRGHFLNWYDTQTLAPLEPRYVSTVDSGNLAASLLVVHAACGEFSGRPILRSEYWSGVEDSLEVLRETIESARVDQGVELTSIAAFVHGVIAQIRERARHSDGPAAVQFLTGVRLAFDRELEQLAHRGMGGVTGTTLKDLETWCRHTERMVERLEHELQWMVPWWPWVNAASPAFDRLDPAGGVGRRWCDLRAMLLRNPTPAQLPACAAEAMRLADELTSQLADAASADLAELLESLKAACAGAAAHAEDLLRGLDEIAAGADRLVRDMDFGFLYDRTAHLLRIGFDVSREESDPHHYDLLASEARLASYLSIAKGDVPEEHWLHLGRRFVRSGGRSVLMSWSATMFEYLMPPLFLRQAPASLLHDSCRGVVDAQIEYGRRRHTPWGISESAYYRFDSHREYQYRAFGVPGLGFKRGLEDDLVIAPYASALAVGVSPAAVVENLERLTGLGVRGRFGFYEAVDFTARRLPPGTDFAVVRSYMCHHQGMILAALDNCLNQDPLPRRFHADPRMRTAEFLIHERPQRRVPLERLKPEIEPAQPHARPRAALTSWRPLRSVYPATHLLASGQYQLRVSDRGHTVASLGQTALVHGASDPSFDRGGMELFLVEIDEQRTRALADVDPLSGVEHQALFSAHCVELQHRTAGLAIHEEIVVSPDGVADLRRIVVANEDGARTRRVAIVSVGEVVLGAEAEFVRHPAFSKLFVSSEPLAEPVGLLFRRRSRGTGEPTLLLGQAVFPGVNAEFAGFETSREAFYGRNGTRTQPASIRTGQLRLGGAVGWTLDPVAVLAVRLVIPPQSSAEFTIVTTAAPSREQVVDNLLRFATQGAREWARQGAAQNSEQELERLAIEPSRLPACQALLSVIRRARPALRVGLQTRWRNQLGQAHLWSHAISGDHPIVLVRVPAVHSAPLLPELLGAQALWRGRGFSFDVVIVNDESSGYGSEARERLSHLAQASGAAEWLNRPGGIYLVHGDQIGNEQRDALNSAACVVLDGSAPLLAQLEVAFLVRPELPALLPTLAVEAAATVAPVTTEPLILENALGGFAADGRGYVIRLDGETPTPAPWSNVAANAQFGFVATEAGGGFTWAVNSGEYRLTTWRNDPVLDEPAEVVYLRDEESTEVWSVTPRPAGAACEVRHDAGVSTWRAMARGLEQRLCMFTVEGRRLKVATLRVSNASGRPRRLTVTWYAEWALGARREPGLALLCARFEHDHELILARSPWHSDFASGVAFAAADRTLHGYTTDRLEFLGPAGDLARPAALRRVGLDSRDDTSADPCAALQVHLDLAIDQVAEVNFLIGHADSIDDARATVTEFREPGRVADALAQTTAAWDRRRGIRVDTPAPEFNLLVGSWLPYQVLSARVWGRTGLYQSSGAFGYRDQLQDVLALIPAEPGLVRDHILDSAAHQFVQGDVLHWWHPPGRVGIRTRCSDDLLWLPYAAAVYVAATGDEAILRETVPYLDGEVLRAGEQERYGHYGPGDQVGTLYEHCIRAIDHASTAGVHGLPLFGSGDWNDGMNRVGAAGRGESVWLAWFLGDVLRRFAAVCRIMADDGRVAVYEQRRRRLCEAAEAYAWDGAWYLRGYHDDGTPLGSAARSTCQIDAIAQAWAVLSGLADPVRARTAMASVQERLIREEDGLALLLTPPFDEGSEDPGYIRAYPPGVRENGGQYTHAAVWTLWAQLELGDVDQAVAGFLRLLPTWHTRDHDALMRYRVEPYCLPGDVAGVAPLLGRGGWTWYTGSAGWACRLGVEGILGLTLVGGRWQVVPRLPTSWPGYRAGIRSAFGNFDLTVTRVEDLAEGTCRTVLDGAPVAGCILPRLDGDTLHVVVVEIPWSRTGRRAATATARQDGNGTAEGPGGAGRGRPIVEHGIRMRESQ